MMPCAIALDVDIPLDTQARFMDAAKKYMTDMRRDSSTALRVSTIDFIKSVRKVTRTSKPYVERKEVRKGRSDPKYLTGTKKKVKGQLYRRMVVKRWVKGNYVNRVVWVKAEQKYSTRMGMRNGNYQGIVRKVDDNTKLVNTTRLTKGKIRRYGLAKKSWGWFMLSLFRQSMTSGKDNPKAIVREGHMVESKHEKTPTAESYTLTNKLDYIRKALQPGGLVTAANQATKSILYKVENKLKSHKFAN